jgi:hypothetical protein
MLPSVIYARDKWLKPGGLILPSHAVVFFLFVYNKFLLMYMMKYKPAIFLLLVSHFTALYGTDYQFREVS